jgi:KDO2-lipid IV(A) lauroyltransferase
VDFFGEKALFPAGPAALAVQTGAALMPVACWFVGASEWATHVYDEIPVPAEGSRREKALAMTQALATVFEQAIREHPEDWHMLQKLFVRDLDPQRLPRRRAGVPAKVTDNVTDKAGDVAAGDVAAVGQLGAAEKLGPGA